MATPEPLYPRRDQHAEPERDESIGGLVKELLSDFSDLMRAEIQMARHEVQHDVSVWGAGAAMIVAGGVVAFLGVVYLLLAAVFALATALPAWLAALIVGGVVLILGGIVAMIGVNRLKSVNPLPDETMQNAREDAEWLRNRIR